MYLGFLMQLGISFSVVFYLLRCCLHFALVRFEFHMIKDPNTKLVFIFFVHKMDVLCRNQQVGLQGFQQPNPCLKRV